MSYVAPVTTSCADPPRRRRASDRETERPAVGEKQPANRPAESSCRAHLRGRVQCISFGNVGPRSGFRHDLRKHVDGRLAALARRDAGPSASRGSSARHRPRSSRRAQRGRGRRAIRQAAATGPSPVPRDRSDARPGGQPDGGRRGVLNDSTGASGGRATFSCPTPRCRLRS